MDSHEPMIKYEFWSGSARPGEFGGGPVGPLGIIRNVLMMVVGTVVALFLLVTMFWLFVAAAAVGAVFLLWFRWKHRRFFRAMREAGEHGDFSGVAQSAGPFGSYVVISSTQSGPVMQGRSEYEGGPVRPLTDDSEPVDVDYEEGDPER